MDEFKILAEPYSNYIVFPDGRVCRVCGDSIRELQGSIDDNGFLTVMVTNVSYPIKKLSVHRLVAENFVPNPNNYKYVVHRDGNKLNNLASNLEWSKNRDYSYAKKNSSTGTPVKCVEDGKIWPSAYAAATDLNVSNTSVYRVLDKPNKTVRGVHLVRI